MNITPVSSPIIERVKKLLSLANSDNANERDVAIAKANALIAEHNIDAVLLQTVDAAKPETFEETVVQTGVRRSVECKFIGWLLHKHFRVEIVIWTRWVTGRRQVDIHFFGRKSDAEFAQWLYGYLREEFSRRWIYFKNSTGAPATERTTFLYGMYEGLNARLQEEAQAVEDKRTAEIAAAQANAQAIGSTVDGIAGQAQTAEQLKGRYALALQDEKESRLAAHRRLHPDLKSGRASRLNLRGTAARDAGRSAGRSISTNRPLAA